MTRSCDEDAPVYPGHQRLWCQSDQVPTPQVVHLSLSLEELDGYDRQLLRAKSAQNAGAFNRGSWKGRTSTQLR